MIYKTRDGDWVMIPKPKKIKPKKAKKDKKEKSKNV